jgi:RNA polymerase sigma-70 factor (ECF subfamily)
LTLWQRSNYHVTFSDIKAEAVTQRNPALLERAHLGREDSRLVADLSNGDEDAFVELVRLHHPSMLRFATTLVGNRAVAEEVVQETWLAILRAIDRFEGRSSLRTWMFTILTNFARKRGAREGRTIPFTALSGAGEESGEPVVDDERFFGPGHRWAGAWTTALDGWDGIPEERLVGREALAVMAAAIDALPPVQGHVMRLRDIDGWSAEDVCNFLRISDSNQRVLLHRARSKVRRAMEAYFAED